MLLGNGANGLGLKAGGQGWAPKETRRLTEPLLGTSHPSPQSLALTHRAEVQRVRQDWDWAQWGLLAGAEVRRSKHQG